ncbi:MAG: helix-turn-helix domain-containing protein [Stigonema ocellatum SAG 48.90 = DSM 106950]|nr:helix-turn-helix domain-containing protein [Stigonema ocellatum SAG 48.90 = DSM 106950]
MSHDLAKGSTKASDNRTGKFLTPFERKMLQKSLHEDLPESYRQRIEIMLLADQGESQTKICQTLGCCPATARHWIHVARTGMAHQWQELPLGRPKVVNEEYLERLKELVTHSPSDYGYTFRRWTKNWLQKHLEKEFGVEVSDRHLQRLLKQMGLSTRPKRNNAEENTNEKATGSKILIRDLNSTNPSDNTEFLPIDLGIDPKIYGAKSTRAVTFCTTVEQYFGVFSFRRGIPAVSSTS